MALIYKKPSGDVKDIDHYSSFGIKKISNTSWEEIKKKNIKRKVPNPPKKPYTYIIRRGGNIYYDFLRKALDKRGWKEIEDGADLNKVKIDLHYADNDKTFWNFKNMPYLSLKDTIRNILEANGKQLIINKAFLPIIASKYMPKTVSIKDGDNISQKINSLGKILILKPAGGHSGYGIIVSNKKDDIVKEAEKLLQNKAKLLTVSNYIDNPMLHEGKKFHIRMWYTILYTGEDIKAFLFDQGAIFTAKKKYKPSDFYNKDIHDTHFKSTPKDILFPQDYKGNSKNVIKQMVDILSHISNEVAPYINSYEESDYAFETFGVDFMIDSNEKVWLIEINFNPIFKTKGLKFNKIISEKYFNSIACMLDLIFPSTYKCKKTNFIPLNIKGGNEKTFIIKSSYFNVDYIKKDLIKRGFREVLLESSPKNVYFIWADFLDKYNKAFYSINSVYKNDIALPKNSMTNKWQLYKKTTKIYPKQDFLPKTVLWDNFTKLPNKKYIIKPVDGLMGIGTKVIMGKELKKIDKEKYINNVIKELNSKNPSKDVIISEYIPNLLLHDNRIFHIRVYYIPALLDNKFSAYLTKFGKIITARKEYSKDLQFDHDVFDSHITGSAMDLIFPEDLKIQNKSKIFNQMKNIMKKITMVFYKDFYNYPEIKNGFSVFGLDFMIDKKLKVYLIEVNPSKTGMKSFTEKYKLEFTKKMWHAISDTILFSKKNKLLCKIY